MVGATIRVYLSQLIQYSRAYGSYQDFLDRWLLLIRKLLNQGFLLVKLKSSLWRFYVMEYLCHNDHEYVPLVVSTSRSFPHSRLITGFVTRLTRRVPLVEQELPTLLENLSPLVLVWFVILDLKFYVYALLIVVWSLMICLLVIVLSVLLR